MTSNPAFVGDDGELEEPSQRHRPVYANGVSGGTVRNVKVLEVELDDLAEGKTKGRSGEIAADSSHDPWAAIELQNHHVPWRELTSRGKLKRATKDVLKIVGVIILLYFFVISLDLLSSAFRLIGGRAAGRAFQESKLLSNPIVGLMIGVLVTVIVQSSSTSTSITIAMVSSGILDVERAIFIIMGANVGTTVTNTFVSLAQSADRNNFRRAFAGATIHDMFNWLTVAILLPIEVATGYLVVLTDAILSNWHPEQNKGGNVELLSAITKPVTHLVIQLDSRVIEDIARNDSSAANKSLVRQFCKGNQECHFLFYNTGLGETTTGLILLLLSLTVLCGALIGIVKILNSIMKGAMAGAIHKALNIDLPGRWSIFTGYIAMAIGAGITFLIQSSSVFTSALTPLVGLGVVTLDRMYPLTLGSNIGTTGTGLLAAMAADSRTLKPALEVALGHLFFNITGILIWYPIPFLRQIPIGLSKMMGNITAEYRWFAVFYIILTFILIPCAIIGLTLAGTVVFMAVGIPVMVLIALVIIMNILQDKAPQVLPKRLRTWDFLPLCMHSLKPYDDMLKRLNCRYCPCRCYKETDKLKNTDNVEQPHI